MAITALSQEILTAEELKTDRKKAQNFDLCALGEKAIYLPGKLLPRRKYIPYNAISRVYKRVAVSSGTGKAFLTPILYIVFQYDGMKEEVVHFKYINDADKMFEALEKTHPEISLMSQAGEEKILREKNERDEIRNRVLDGDAAHAVRQLQSAKEFLEKRPGLSKRLAVTSREKKTVDAIKPAYQWFAVLVILLGAAAAVYGVYLLKTKGLSDSILWLLGGIAAVFIMVNSRVLPAPKYNRWYAAKQWNSAMDAVKANLKGYPKFPIPAEYAHPYTLKRMIRIVREGRASSADEALAVLKEDLKAADSSVSLGREDYEEIMTIKPMFMINDYK